MQKHRFKVCSYIESIWVWQMKRTDKWWEKSEMTFWNRSGSSNGNGYEKKFDMKWRGLPSWLIPIYDKAFCKIKGPKKEDYYSIHIRLSIWSEWILLSSDVTLYCIGVMSRLAWPGPASRRQIRLSRGQTRNPTRFQRLYDVLEYFRSPATKSYRTIIEDAPGNSYI